MIFVDTNIFMYSVGRPHPLRDPAREFFFVSMREGKSLCTSAEVLQELAHAYLAVDRRHTLQAALSLIVKARVEIWPLESEDVLFAIQMHQQFPALSTRDLCHLACCQRRGVNQIKTFDHRLASAATPKNRH